MKKTILIPTDFSVGSLNVLKSFLSENNDGSTRYNVILLYGYYLSSSITDLLFMSKTQIIQSLVTDEFEEACDIIKNKFGGLIASVRIDLFTGFTQAAFENYIEANRIEEICISTQSGAKKNSRNSLDLTRFIKKSTVTITEIQCGNAGNADFPETEKNIAAVFVPNPMTMSVN